MTGTQQQTHRKRRELGIQSKFLIGLAVILLFFCLMAASLIYMYQKNMLHDEAFRKAELVMATVNASRKYVREVLRPKMYETLGQDAFVIEAMSTSFVTRQIMEYFNEEVPEFQYRRVAINAKNPDFEANEMEREMIRYFQEHPEAESWKEITKINDTRYFVHFQPVRFNDSCLHCHGEPADAPPQVNDLFGKLRGFHHRTDRLSSVSSIAIPVETGLKHIQEVAFLVFVTSFLGGLLLYVIICFVFNRMIVQNLRGLLGVIWDNLDDQYGKRLYGKTAHMDEIGELHAAGEMMAGHLQETQSQLRDYADNLEKKVDERTVALQKSEQLLWQKVIDRNRELIALNTIAELITQSTRLTDILPRVLGQALTLVPAKGAGIYLLTAGASELVLQCQENAPQLKDRVFGEEGLSCGFVGQEGGEGKAPCAIGCRQLYFHSNGGDAAINCLNVPLCCRDQVLGVMMFTDIAVEEINAELQELLFSIGRQVGITIESLQNMQRLLQSKEILQSVFDGITDFVVLLSAAGLLKMANKALLHRYGLAMEDIMGAKVEELAIAHPEPFALLARITAVNLREPFSDLIQLASGEEFEVHFYPVFATDGKLEDVVCYVKNVTLQKKAEHRIQQTEKLVAIGQLAAGVAHEINNPLGIILTYTDLLKEDLKGMPQQREDLQTIEKHVSNCQRIVADLLKFAHSQSSACRMDVSINQVIEDAMHMTHNQFRKRGIAVESVLAQGLPVLKLDADRMRQVFINLFMNAAQAISGEGLIRVTSKHRRESRQVEISVEDNGAGIQTAVINKIFDPFFTTKEPGQGTGLGLSLSYGIIQDHGGEIRVNSTVGQGTRFRIFLPVDGGPAQESLP